VALAVPAAPISSVARATRQPAARLSEIARGDAAPTGVGRSHDDDCSVAASLLAGILPIVMGYAWKRASTAGPSDARCRTSEVRQKIPTRAKPLDPRGNEVRIKDLTFWPPGNPD
jgi:hypothetical protein